MVKSTLEGRAELPAKNQDYCDYYFTKPGPQSSKSSNTMGLQLHTWCDLKLFKFIHKDYTAKEKWHASAEEHDQTGSEQKYSQPPIKQPPSGKWIGPT